MADVVRRHRASLRRVGGLSLLLDGQSTAHITSVPRERGEGWVLTYPLFAVMILQRIRQAIDVLIFKFFMPKSNSPPVIVLYLSRWQPKMLCHQPIRKNSWPVRGGRNRLLSEAVLKYHLDQQTGMRDDTEGNERPQKDAVCHHGSQSPLGLQAGPIGSVLTADDTAFLAALSRIHGRVGAERRSGPLHPPGSTLRRSPAGLRSTPDDRGHAAAARAGPAPPGRRLPVCRQVAGSRRRCLAGRHLGVLAAGSSEGDKAGVGLAFWETIGREDSGGKVDGPLGTALRWILLGVDIGYDDCHHKSYGNHEHCGREEHACQTDWFKTSTK